MGFIDSKYNAFIDKYGYVPTMFNPYNIKEITELSPTITRRCEDIGTSSQVLIMEDKMNNNMIVWGNTVPSEHTAGRIFDINGISPTVMYRHSKVVQIKENNILKGVNNMERFENNLPKFNYNMETIRLFDAFMGVGALHQALKELGVPVKIVHSSEIDIDAIISYAAIHIDNFKNLEFEYPSETDMREWLMAKNIGYSFEKDKSSIPRLKKEKLYQVYKASVLLNNLGDISKINPSDMQDFDLFNLSFACTDISNAGKQKGLKNDDGTPTRSGLVKYGIDLIKAKKPKYIMIENVKALIQKKFIGDFYDIVNEIESYGYNCYYPTKEDKKGNKTPACLNAKNYGIAQNRERIFVICVRKDIDNGGFEFPQGFDSGLRLKDFLEDTVDEKYYLSEEIQKRFKLSGSEDVEHNELNVIGSSAPDFRTIGQRDMTYGTNGIMSTLTATDYKQPKQIVDKQGMVNYNYEVKIRENGISNCIDTGIGRFPDNHGSRTGVIEFESINIDTNKLDDSGYTVCEKRCDEGIRFFNDNVCGSLRTIDSCGDKRIIETENELNQIGTLDIKGNDCIRRVYGNDGLCPTITTMEGGNRQPKTYESFRIRKLTPKECFRLMGFKDECFDRAKEMGISDSSLYKQAGNSIVVNCLYYIFKNLFQEYIK